MALQKVPIDINFTQGLETKVDPFQLPPGKFLSLVNTTFNKAGQLTKRNGFGQLTELPVDDTVTATTFNGNLLAIGNSIQALSADTNTWYNKGVIQPVDLKVVPQVRTSTSQLTCDAVVASNGLSCVAWYDSNTNSYYRILDSVSGEVIVDTTQLPATVSATVGPKVFCLGGYFIVVFWETVSATPTLRYVAIPISNPTAPKTVTTILAGHSITSPFDGYVSPSSNLYIALYGASTTIKLLYITPNLALSSVVTISSVTVGCLSVAVDTAGPLIWVTWWDSNSGLTNTASYDSNLNAVTTTTFLVAESLVQAISSATAPNTGLLGTLHVLIDIGGEYSFVSNSPATPTLAGVGSGQSRTDHVDAVTYNPNTTTVGTPTTILHGVGLASKAFYLSSSGNIHALVTYGGLMQPTYFLSDFTGNIVAKLAPGNGGAYYPTTNLPGVTVNGTSVQIGYLYKDLIASVNKTTPTAGTQPAQIAGIYNQAGINLANITFTQGGVNSAELGGSLQLTGGFLWQYDGVKPVEQGFHLFPEDLGTTTRTTGGALTAQTYAYVAVYEWTDGAGNINRSAPSVPVFQVVPAGTSTNENSINIPTLRLTYKTTPNPVRIVLYRWSTANQIYYQLTSISSPIINDPTVNSVLYNDLLADSSIIGNNILYTNGGVVENVPPPAVTSITPYNTRLFAIDAEDRNLLWFSKQVIENTPVEMSDLFTLYVSPTISATGSTGPMACLSAMDDKLIIFKKDAIYYITGNGPDNTGASNDFSNPTFITSTVGCNNQQSIVFMPNGLMFQSDKGIWLLGRDLSTSYIGAPVEEFNNFKVVAANNIPGTNQVRFRLSNGITLMYDYYYNQWGSFVGISGVSSTIYRDLETVITASQTVTPPNQGSYQVNPQVYQETPGVYLDGTNPVLMSFQTGWFALSGLQGYERFYQMLLLGTYITPFKLNVQFAYDFVSSNVQSTVVTPLAPAPAFGLQPGPFGSGSPYGGNETTFKARVFPVKQKCESFQLSVNEIYDPSYSIAAGAGLTLSGVQLLVGSKKASRTQSAGRSFG